jgi:hypothetical protein
MLEKYKIYRQLLEQMMITKSNEVIRIRMMQNSLIETGK